MDTNKYWILKRQKPVISAYFHAKANMTGIPEAKDLLKIPRIYYYIRRNIAQMIRLEEDRSVYMKELAHWVLEKPEVINSIMKEGLKSNGQVRKIIDKIMKNDLGKVSKERLAELLFEMDDVIQGNWLRATFIPYYIGDVPGFEKKVDQALINKLRLRTLADEAMPAMYRLSAEILRRNGIRTTHAECATFEELIGSFNCKGPDPRVLERRYGACLISVSKGKWSVRDGRKAIEEGEKFLKRAGEKGELTGMATFRGKVVGRAFIANRAADLKKMGKGQVLVTHMTTPDYVPYFSRVAAIVTDEGGITCHAAIVSREFKIPCIVGTRIATRLLKTGDKIEVDANTGKIRKL